MDITSSGIRLDGSAEFIGPLYAQNISTDQVTSALSGIIKFIDGIIYIYFFS